jgi:hypothetical protein
MFGEVGMDEASHLPSAEDGRRAERLATPVRVDHQLVGVPHRADQAKTLAHVDATLDRVLLKDGTTVGSPKRAAALNQ